MPENSAPESLALEKPAPEKLLDKSALYESPPPILGPYRVQEKLGRGGMGEVYRAIDERLDRPVALKLLYGREPDLVERFVREARNQASVDHEHVCRVYEAGELEGRHYIAMQYLEGETLDVAAPDCSLEEKVALLREIALALHSAHRQGLVHRDIKPTNVIVTRDEHGRGKPFVVDFGLACEITSEMTHSDHMMGTPQYMAPEQLSGGSIDRRTDVYSLGVTMFQAFAGRLPFEGGFGSMLRQVLESEAPPLRRFVPSLPLDVETIVAKCLEKDPRRRYSSARALAEDLERYLAGEPILARPTSLAGRMAKKARKHRWAVASAAAVCFLLIGVLVWSVRLRWNAEQKTRLAQSFAGKVERLAATARHARMSPLHDLSADQEEMRRKMDEIEEDMRRLGSVALGPGHDALGRGALILGEAAQARNHLEQAVELGYRGPETVLALGRAFGLLYQQELRELDRILDEDERDRRRARIDAELRDPAVAALRESEGAALTHPDLLRAELAFYGGDLEAAVEAAQSAVADVPWLYEARVLEGRAHLRRARDLEQSGDYEDAAARLREARTAFAAALEIGRSHPPALESDCHVSLLLLRLEVRGRGEFVDELWREGVATCEKALIARPRSPEALETLAGLHYRYGEGLMVRGEDPREVYERSIAASTKALEIRPDWALPQIHLGNVRTQFGVYAMRRGEDPTPAFEAAVEDLRRAVELDPRLSDSHGNLANVHLYLAFHRLESGQEIEPALESARGSYERAIELRPKNSTYYNNLGIVHLLSAQESFYFGKDPRPTLERALDVFGQAYEINPNNAFVHANQGDCLRLKAQFELWTGADPRSSIDQAIASYERTLEIHVRYAPALSALADAHRIHADWSARRGEDPAAALAAGRHAVEASLEKNSQNSEAHVIRALLALTEGRWAASQGKAFDAAELEAAARRGVELKKDSGEAWLTLAKAMLFLNRPQAGFEAARSALEATPRRAEALAVEALLDLAAARSLSGEEAREAERSGREKWSRAIEKNPYIETFYGQKEDFRGTT